MPAILMTGAAGQGKTHAAIHRIKALMRRKLFGKVWVLLPTELQIASFRSRLLDLTDDAAHFGVECFDFYDLYGRLLEIVGAPQRQVKDTARFRILRHILTQVEGDLWHFNRIAQTPGFVALVAAFIEELKQAQITPEQFNALVQNPKDHDLATIYAAYQSFLREYALVDGEGEGWLALARLEDEPDLKLGVDLLIVDGYDQFNLIQAQLLTRLATHVNTMFLTLTYQAERAETAHRRFAQTRERLIDAGGEWIEQSVADQHLGDLRTSRQPALRYLSDRLFDSRPEPVAHDGTVTLVEAPDRLREVQAVLRQVKHLLVESGVEPEQVTILARDLQPYTAYFLETAPAYGIPLAIRRGTPLSENPAVATFLSLIDLADEDFPRRATVDILHSPYLECPDLTPVQIDMLDRISRSQIVVRGREHWLDAVERASQPKSEDEDELSAGRLAPEDMSALRAGMESFLERVTPPEQATARDYIRWLESLIGPDSAAEVMDQDDTETFKHFHMIDRIRAGTAPDIAARDLLALSCLKRVFLDVLSAYELIDAWSPVPWGSFRLDLRIAIDNAMVNPARTTNRLGRVLLASVYEARGLPHDHVFLMGLSEGEFPARSVEDALYVDAERQRMKNEGLPLLTHAEQADESSLFYEITSLARQSLTLTRPYIDDKGNPWPASPYWRAVQAVIDVEPVRLPMTATATLDNAAHASEVMIALAQALSGKATPIIFATHNWLIARPDLAARWGNTLRCRQVESRREADRVPHDAYTGRLSHPAMLQMVGEMLGPDYLWSASQFNDYGICPYRFFARRLLKLEAIKEPEEGMDQLQLGSVYHEILEHTYRQIAHEGLPITPDNCSRAMEILNEMCCYLLADAPRRHGFRASATWRQEQEIMRDRLYRLVRADFSGEMDKPLEDILSGVRYAYEQEVQFGFDDQEPLIIDGMAGPLRVRGKIDRIDMVDGQAVVFDYKTGGSAIPAMEMAEGRNVQMMLYMLAARKILDDRTVSAAAFWHIGKNTLSGQIRADDPRLDEARQNLHERIAQGRQGIFVNVPSKSSGGHCSAHCEYSQLCRFGRASSRKPVQAEDQPV